MRTTTRPTPLAATARDLWRQGVGLGRLPGTGLLVLRTVVGATFLAHGIDKLGDLPGTERFFASIEIPAPALMAPFVTFVEIAGGLLLVAGLATPLAGVVLAGDMVVAALTAKLGHGFFAADGGYELELLLGAACVACAFLGGGRLSADAALGLQRPR